MSVCESVLWPGRNRNALAGTFPMHLNVIRGGKQSTCLWYTHSATRRIPPTHTKTHIHLHTHTGTHTHSNSPKRNHNVRPLLLPSNWTFIVLSSTELMWTFFPSPSILPFATSSSAHFRPRPQVTWRTTSSICPRMLSRPGTTTSSTPSSRA